MISIGITGGSGSGKTTLVKRIIQTLPPGSASVLCQDAYYHDQRHLTTEEKKHINFDHPDAIEWDLLIRHLDLLRNGQPARMPVYSFATCTRLDETVPVEPPVILLIEGILILTQLDIRNRLDMKIFVEASSATRLQRIIQRDRSERGRSEEEARVHFETFVKPMHEQFIEPTRNMSDLIISGEGDNEEAVEMLMSFICKRSNKQP